MKSVVVEQAVVASSFVEIDVLDARRTVGLSAGCKAVFFSRIFFSGKGATFSKFTLSCIAIFLN